MTAPRRIWGEVFAGRVERALELTRAERSTGRPSVTTTGPDRRATALYIEPSLASLVGHQANLAACYCDLLRDGGYRPIVVHALRSELPPRPDWNPFFLVRHHTLAHRGVERGVELERVNAYFSAEFGTLVARWEPRVCVFPTVRHVNVMAAAAVAAQAPGKPSRGVVLGVMEADQVPDCEDPELVASAFAGAAEILLANATPYLVIAETAPVRDFLLACGFAADAVRIFPYVAANDIVTDVRRTGTGTRVGYLGDSRAVRNPGVVADLVIARPTIGTVRWCVQFDLAYLARVRGAPLVERLRELARRDTIELQPTGLDEPDYRALFCSLDLIVLPYSDRYDHIGSGILVEAIYAGVVPIVPRGSAMERFYNALGGSAPTFGELSVAAIGEAIAQAAARIEALKGIAVTVRSQWREHPSAAEQWRSEMAAWLGRLRDDNGHDPGMPANGQR